MTPDQIERVRASWTLIVPIAETVAARFYERLFELDPALRPLFNHVDPQTQRRKLVQTLAIVVAGVDNLWRLLPAIEALGRRHVDYGVRDADYATVGKALLSTFEQGLGDAFDEATRDAWTAAYELLSTAMLRAAATMEQPMA
jgi:hemoglobin-like flavoprotein